MSPATSGGDSTDREGAEWVDGGVEDLKAELMEEGASRKNAAAEGLEYRVDLQARYDDDPHGTTSVRED